MRGERGIVIRPFTWTCVTLSALALGRETSAACGHSNAHIVGLIVIALRWYWKVIRVGKHDLL